MQILKKHRAFAGDLHFCQHASSSTGTKMRFSTYRPDNSKRASGILIWLSGLTCTEENFMAKASAFRALHYHNLMIICPDTSPRGLNLKDEGTSWDFGSGASFYVDATTPGYRDHYRMETYVTREIPTLIENEFGLGDKISLFGHSMGGHGALALGLRNPELFQSLSALAPIAHPTACPWGQKAFRGYLGDDQTAWSQYDASLLMRAGHRHPREILVDQGGSDEFLKLQLQPEALESAVHSTTSSRASQQKFKFRMQAGYDHSYYFISSFVDDHIAHHAAHLTASSKK